MPRRFILMQAMLAQMLPGSPASPRWAAFALCCAAWLPFSLGLAAQDKTPAAATQPLRAGPSYTIDPAAKSQPPVSTPVYPEFDVVVPLDAKWSAYALDPAGWQASEPGSSAPLNASRVRRFEETGYGLSVVLALDVSGSMRGRTLDIIRTSVTKFVDDAKPEDRVAVMTFADSPRWDVPFTAQPAQVRKAIQGLAARGRETHLYDSMIAAIDSFDDSMPIRRVLLVMSDGHDEGSTHTLRNVIDEAEARHISIHSIGISRSNPKYLAMLQSASSSTGGNYAAARSDEEMEQLLRNGIASLQQTPVVTFTAAFGSAGGDPVSIDITWNPQNIHAAGLLNTYQLAGSARVISTLRKRPIVLVGLAALLLLLILLAFILSSRRRPQPEPYVDPSFVPSTPEFNAIAAAPTCRAPPPPLPASYTPTRIEPDPSLEAPPRTETKVERRQTRMPEMFPATQGQPVAVLVALEGPRAGDRIPVAELPFTIGAHESNVLRIDDPTLSSRHVSLLRESSVLLLDDLGSTNGTYLNGTLLRGARRALSPGDELRAGRSVFRVERPCGLEGPVVAPA